MPLINCKLYLELNWCENCEMSNVATATTFQITSTKLHLPVVTLQTKHNTKLIKQLSKGLKRSVYWNEYKNKIQAQEADANNYKRFLLGASFQGVNRLFVD